MDEGISVIIPNYNGRAFLEQFLPTVLSACEAYPGKSEVLVVDDSSTDTSLEYLQGIGKVRVVRKDGPRGFSGTCNEGARSAAYGILIFLNNDVEVEKDFIVPLVGHFDRQEVFAVTCKSYGLPVRKFRDGGKLYEFRKGFFKVHRNYDVPDERETSITKEPLPSFMFSAAHAAVRKNMFLQIGGFDVAFSPFNWEDADLSYRAWKRGWEIHYEPGSKVYHVGNATINSYHKKLLVRMVSKRNRLLMMWKNLRDPSFLTIHILYLSLWLVLYACVLNFVEIGAFLMAFRRLPSILREKRKEKRHVKKTDKDIEQLFREFVLRSEVKIIN